MLDADKYLNERVKQYQSWYNAKAVTMKARYLRMKAISVLGGALVPVLANVRLDLTIGGYSVVTLALTVISLMVVVFVSLETVFHYREQWKNYRSTEQRIGHEVVRFQSGVSPYLGLEAGAAFRLLVERVEDTISAENAATLNVLTHATETADAKAARSEGKAE